MIALDEARRYVLGACRALAPRRVPLAGALGLVLAEDVASPEPVPPFAGSAMDGFAVRAADTVGAADEAPAVLTVVATLAAGQAPSVAVGPGEAIRIMTGAPLPPGADAVVMVERTAAADDGATVAILTAVAPGTAVRPTGDDLTAGQAVFAAGKVLSPGHLGVLASIGRLDVLAVPRPVVGVFSTGDELVEGGGPLGPGQIRDSNRLTLLALLRDSGCETVDLGRVGDDPDAIAAVLRRGVEACDAVVTSGGVSMGDFDYVKVVLDRLGEMRWMQVAIKPAKPLAFGTVDGVPVFGLPGNPVSSMVSFELFARPALRRMAGRADGELDRPTVAATAAEPLRRRPDGKIHFARVTCGYDLAAGAFRVRSAGGQGSHQLTAMAGADGLAVLPDGDTVDAGATVDVLLLGEWGVIEGTMTVPLVDSFGRVHRDLRISVTDRCNFRCTYCMPEEGMTWLPHEELLSYEELARVAGVLVDRFAIDSIRLTGGEPTVRARLPVLVGKLAALRVEGRPVDLALTTNGSALASQAHDLAAAGLRRINVSLDSLRRDRFAEVTKRDELPAVLAGIDAALDAGLAPLKLNVVVVRGVNDDELVDFAAFARSRPVVVRFIEFMPLDAQEAWTSGQVVTRDEILATIDAVFPLTPLGADGEVRPDDPSSPAERFRFRDGAGEIGVIPSVSEAFCGTCDRIRLSADGHLRSCLFALDSYDLRAPLRAGADDAELAAIVAGAVAAKWAGHHINQSVFIRPRHSMSQIGG